MAYDSGFGTDRRVGRDENPHTPLVPNRIPIYGSIYDVSTGELLEVPKANKAGEPGAQTRAAKD